MCDHKKVYDLILKCSLPETSSEDRKSCYLQALGIVRTPVKGPPEGFNEFWAIYPHKKAKRYAEKAFRVAIKLTDLQTILQGVEHYKRNKPDEHPWAFPASWLNAGRWEDGQYIKPADIIYDWPEWKLKLKSFLRDADINVWFSNVEYVNGVFYVETRPKWQWIKDRYSIDMKKVFGEFELEVRK